jgi:cysteinyl-tRNA synthetase
MLDESAAFEALIKTASTHSAPAVRKPVMSLHVQNSLTRRKEELRPVTPGQLGIYVCGPTVYSHSHLGHAKSYVGFDVIVKWLRLSDLKVRYVQNITDVGHLTDNADEGEDKIARQARIDQVHPLEVVDVYMRSYMDDMVALGVAHPNIYVRATQHIPEQIELTAKLIERGHAYEKGGNVYFDVSSWPEYGILSGRKTEDQVEGHRIEVRSDKRSPQDFALWKSAEGTKHILRWSSPWGSGYPGWHVECSAMAMKYLGETFDIHGGGNENKFPHHECEIAQSRAGTGGEFARVWLHNNMINIDGQKMSKSLGNSVLIKDALRDFSPAAIRFFLLSTHYASPSNYTRDALTGATGGVQRLGEARAALAKSLTGAAAAADGDRALLDAAAAAQHEITESMDDDFNTPLAIAALFNLVKVVHKTLPAGVGAGAIEAAALVFDRYGRDLLGCMNPAATQSSGDAAFEAGLMGTLLDLRTALREQKQWALADLLRDKLGALGVAIKDGKDGASWSRQG